MEQKALSTAATTGENPLDYKSVNTFLSSMSRNKIDKTNFKTNCYLYGLVHFQRFLAVKYPKYNVETILKPLSSINPINGNGEDGLNLYTILDQFVSYLLLDSDNKTTMNLTRRSIIMYVSSIRSYLSYFDIDTIPAKFKRKVKMPKLYREDETPLDASDIRNLLIKCTNKKLKTYLLVLASGGMRTNEALAMRLKDINFSVNPTRIHIRKEYAKTKVARDVYISDEATDYLKKWLEWKYRDKTKERLRTLTKNDNDLVFAAFNTSDNPSGLYVNIVKEFQKLLSVVELDERKEGKQRRRKITLHSFRRFVKTLIAGQVNTDYSEWFLGHNKSPYYTLKEQERRQIYAEKCMNKLTFLDYSTLEIVGKNTDDKLKNMEKRMSIMMNTQKEMQLLLNDPKRLTEILEKERNE
jgi:integrase